MLQIIFFESILILWRGKICRIGMAWYPPGRLVEETGAEHNKDKVLTN